jgi:nitrate reductase NapA
MKNGKYDKNGEFTADQLGQAFDIMAEKWKAALKPSHGPEPVAMFGSGQWTIWEGYAAAKLMKAGFRTNNLDPNARHCMASAVAGFMRTFGIDEPMGCYDDIEQADAFVLWGSNMAEMHPILWSRITDRRLTHPHVQGARAVDLRAPQLRAGRQRHDLHAADRPGDPQLHLQPHHPERQGEQDFVKKHVNFKKARPTSATACARTTRSKRRPQRLPGRRRQAQGRTGNERADHLRRIQEVRLRVHAGEGVQALRRAAGQAEALAELYADPKTKVVSFWTMGFNQHTRGTWVNNMIYNVHLLTGKISEPGNSPFSLTGQPSACGTAREVGTFAHRLPADMVVTNPKHRKHTEKIWQLPEGTIPDKDRPARRGPEPRAEGRQAQVLLDHDHQQHAGRAEHQRRDLSGLAQSGGLRRGLRPYPTVSALSADLILPAAMWVEKEGAYGNAERRTQFWRQQVKAPGEARPTCGSTWSSPSASRWKRCGRPSCIAKKPEYKGKTLFDVLYANGRSTSSRWPRSPRSTPRHQGLHQRRVQGLRLLRAEGPVRGIRRSSAAATATTCALRRLSQGARPALAGGRRQGNAVALPRGLRPLREGRARA